MADVFLSWVFLFSALDDCIEEHGMSCSAQASPFDVQLDDYTIVQPDVMVFCRDPLQVYADRATAAPDLVIEVLSKSTAFRDRHLKLFKYQRAGVREVWLVSPGAAPAGCMAGKNKKKHCLPVNSVLSS